LACGACSSAQGSRSDGGLEAAGGDSWWHVAAAGVVCLAFWCMRCCDQVIIKGMIKGTTLGLP
jgi:hypothetical protein